MTVTSGLDLLGERLFISRRHLRPVAREHRVRHPAEQDPIDRIRERDLAAAEALIALGRRGDEGHAVVDVTRGGDDEST
jgi:hypothetical protein